ncbi:nitrate- and nitrite sensing domain-containing protein [Micromonospora sp. WMMD882]|uniref:nitrate- and nitrite sensing domain-containing protein n=1 Tax=Micromonospora sp. WMMD882 TaxID=3015151 RepID=UPI00248BA038|nr:nitrate- and nitrite sensing domain-containing protein [Micromonospora sp. WMMD882]WBB80173.1 nitrate- and nitrite sensing domain-containing protein [Micromonospora sp. WMMD882]
MGSRSTNLRTKVIALLASLVALWAFAAWVTVRDGFNLLGVQTLNSRVFAPSEPLLLQLQKERRLSLAYLGRPEAGQLEQLRAERDRTDGLAGAFEESAAHWRTEISASAEVERAIDDVLSGLDGLDRIRTEIDDKSIDRTATLGAYVDVVDSIFQLYDELGGLDDRQVAHDTAALIELNRSRELLSQEDALLTGALAAGRVISAEQAQFAQLVGAQRYTAANSIASLPGADRNRYRQMSESDAFQRLRTLEAQVITARNTEARPPVEADAWRAAVEPALQQLNDVVGAGGEDVVDRAAPVAVGVILRLVLATGLGLLAVVASIIVSITTARTLLRQLERLQGAAFTLANERLPNVVARLGRGEEVDVAAEAPPLEFGDDEIGQVGQAFNVVQETAVRTAVEQAELRRNVRDVFLSLARRTQALVHRQLTLLDAMERRENDAEELEDLFRVDHLATRMRRNAENLIVLSGSTPGRAWRRNVPMVDVVRGAVAEVEDYTRVNVLPLGQVALAGRAVGDIIHLLAELIENGLSFSPPHTTVEVRGQLVANGFVIEIEDRGLGMTEEDLAAANGRIMDRSELNLANATRLGLYVVSRLTERHGIRVHLKESPYGGTTAVVLIPMGLVTVGEEETGGATGTRPGQPEPADAAGPGGGQPGPRPAAVVEPAAPPLPRGDESHQLPTRVRTTLERPRAPRDTPVESGSGLPTRPRRWSEQSALDGPTFPTGLPVTVPRTEPGGGPAPTVPPAAPTQGEPTTASVPAAPAPSAELAAPTTSAELAAPAPSAELPRTGSGLPFRVRQANLAPELREETSSVDAAEDETVRPPEQVRRMMSSYQTGTRRGRTDAARLLGGPGRGPEQTNGPDDEDSQAT